jgi:hypothetical protein
MLSNHERGEFMGIGLFKKPYTLRKHGKQTNIDGHMVAPYTDMIVRLNVQPQAPNEYEGDPEGERTIKRLKSWGPSQLASADEYSNTPGDLLFYKGIWYECTSSADWDHTILSHFQSDFVALPASKQPPPPTEVVP